MMELINLRDYNKEIDGLIQSGQYILAIRHCHHILNTYPKYLDVYKLLGKAYLENKQLLEAADVFLRLLSAIPDEFTALVGIGVIRQEQLKYDEAIWYFMRAFEVQPYNLSIQKELKYLYKLREGVEPGKIILTHASLARMYFRGNLISQAIAETRAALVDNTDRYDLQILLARLLSHTNNGILEATNICLELLKKYPYCQEANLLMVNMLANEQQPEKSLKYRERLIELDPYYEFISSEFATVNNIPEEKIKIQKYSSETPLGEDGIQTNQNIKDNEFENESNGILDKEIIIPPVTSSDEWKYENEF